MADTIQTQLNALGVAQVMVALKAPAAPVPAAAGGGIALAAAGDSPALVGMQNYFEHSEFSLNTALARAGNVRAAAAGGRRQRGAAPAPPTALSFPNLGLMLGTVSRAGLTALRADPRVAKVTAAPQLRLIRPTNVAPAKLSQDLTWGIRTLEVPQLWAQGLTGKGVRVGHLDTGVDASHPALRQAVVAFAELNLFGEQVAPAPAPRDTDDHGTHTAGTIAGRPVQGRHIGVAPGAELASAIVIEGGNVIARVLGGMDWAISQNVRVLNISLGIPFTPPLTEFNLLLRILRARGVLPVVAVGNEGPGTSRPPGNHPEALSVGALNEAGAIAERSSSQRFARAQDPLVPDLVAPGVNVVSAQPGGGYQAMDGSSMATPHVAGLAALLMEASPTATIDQIETAIFTSCRATGLPAERANRGVPSAVRALAALTGVNLSGSTKGKQGKSKKKSKKPGSKSAQPAGKAKTVAGGARKRVRK